MQEIMIDFEVFKALTARRVDERHTYNDVIRDLLNLDSLLEPSDAVDWILEGESDPGHRFVSLASIGAPKGFSARGIYLPNGTRLKATYKQSQYMASIDGGCWIDADGKSHKSPSAAAKSITGSNVNGLRFWHAKRPTDTEWRRLDMLA
jgi:hypothetical protein